MTEVALSIFVVEDKNKTKETKKRKKQNKKIVQGVLECRV